MNLYSFYRLQHDDLSSGVNLNCIKINGEMYELYAATTKKKFAKEFRLQRDMSEFICRKIRGITVDDYRAFANENRGAVLEKFSLITIIGKNRSFQNIESVNVLMTLFEKQVIDEPVKTFDDELFWEKAPHPGVFTNKVIRSLQVLQYCVLYKLMCQDDENELKHDLLFSNSFSGIAATENDYSGPDISIDEVAVFVSSFKEILKP